MSVAINKAGLFAQLKYKPHAGQLLVHNSRARHRVLVAGVRWGKSTCAAMEVACELLAPRKDSTGWVVAPTYDLTQRITTQVRIAFLTHFSRRVIEDDERSQRFVVQNLGGGTSEMRGKSSDNAASLLGEGLDWLVLDEAAKVKQEIYESYLAPRLVDRRGRALLISTPRGIDWFFREFKRGQKGRDPEYESWRAPTTDNPAIKPEVVEAERGRLPKDAFAQEYLAEFIGEDPDPCEQCGNPSETIVRDIVFADYASEPRCALCGGVVDLKGRTREWRRGGPRLIVNLGPGTRLEPGQDFATVIAEMRAAMERGRGVSRAS